jgi:hypothetical protein
MSPRLKKALSRNDSPKNVPYFIFFNRIPKRKRNPLIFLITNSIRAIIRTKEIAQMLTYFIEIDRSKGIINEPIQKMMV